MGVMSILKLLVTMVSVKTGIIIWVANLGRYVQFGVFPEDISGRLEYYWRYEGNGYPWRTSKRPIAMSLFIKGIADGTIEDGWCDNAYLQTGGLGEGV